MPTPFGSRRLLYALICLVWIARGAALCAQTPPTLAAPPDKATGEKAPADAASAGREGAVQEVKPELFYLPDKNGKLQAVPGFGFEDFIRLWRWQQQLEKPPEAKPLFTLQDVSLNGESLA